MNVLTIIGTPHKGNTRAIVDLFLDEFKDKNNKFDEIVLSNDFKYFCGGCANCILKGEDKCPHYKEINPIVEKIEKADLIILATPVFVGSCSSSMKALLDHLAYMWLVHRPKASMFNKVGLVITTAGGSGVKETTKLLKKNLFYLGVPKVYKLGVALMAPTLDEMKNKKKKKVEKRISKLSRKIEKKNGKVKPKFKTKAFFFIMHLMQKNGYNELDKNYWNERNWTKKSRPWKNK